MKKFAGIILAILICNFSAFAQVKFGVKAGISIATQDIEYPPLFKENLVISEMKSVESMTGGFFLNISLPGLPLSIQPELLYTVKGSETISTYNNQPYREKIRIHYAEIPVLLKYSFPLPGITPNVFAGPFLDYKIEEEPGFIIDTDFGITAGGGIDFNVLTTPVTIDARYTLGLTNVYDEGTPTVIMQDGQSYKNRAWMVMLGAAF